MEAFDVNLPDWWFTDKSKRIAEKIYVCDGTAIDGLIHRFDDDTVSEDYAQEDRRELFPVIYSRMAVTELT